MSLGINFIYQSYEVVRRKRTIIYQNEAIKNVLNRKINDNYILFITGNGNVTTLTL